MGSTAREGFVSHVTVRATPMRLGEFARSLYRPTVGNAAGWALALGVVGAWQYYEAKRGGEWSEGTAAAWNAKVLASKKKKDEH